MKAVVASICLFVSFSAASLAAGTWKLQIGSVDGRPGSQVEVPVRLAGGSPGAVAFTIAYDSTRLTLAADPASSLSLPSGFVATVLTSANRVSFAIYDPIGPVPPIPDGTLATLRFSVKENSDGFAPVAVDQSIPPTAASPSGELLTFAGASNGGVTLGSKTGVLAIAPSSIDFGSVPAGTTVTRTLIITNSGSAPLTVSGVGAASPASPFAVSAAAPLPVTLQPGSSLPVNVTFRSDTVGSFQDSVVIEGDSMTRSAALSATATDSGTYALTAHSLLPAAAHIDGATQWRSSLALLNSGDLPARVLLTALGAGTPHTIDLPPHASVTTEDLVGEYFGLANATIPILIESSSPDVLAKSETYSLTANGGHVAQSVPVIRWEELARTGQRINLFALERSDTERSNVALVNVSTSDAVLRVTVRDSSGAPLGAREYYVGANQTASANDLFDLPGVPGQHDISVAIESLTPDATFFAYASTIDLRSGAPVFQPAR